MAAENSVLSYHLGELYGTGRDVTDRCLVVWQWAMFSEVEDFENSSGNRRSKAERPNQPLFAPQA